MNYKNLLPMLIPFAMLTACSDHDTSSDTVAETYASDTNKEPMPEVSESQILFEQKCSLCHGNDGTAGIGNAANLQTSKADSITSFKIIMDGKSSMPSFKDQLSEQQIHKLANYVFSLRK